MTENIMTMRVALAVLVAFSSSAKITLADDSWCYKDKSCDAKQWKGLCRTGTVQSPIDISTSAVKVNNTEMQLRFNKEYMDVHDEFLIKNNGHTVQVQLKDDLTSDLMLDGDGLSGSYHFSQLHFHWGATHDRGSEHTINGKAFPLELHLVHYNSKYDGLGKAVTSENHRALLVLGIFFELSRQENPALRSILEAMKMKSSKAHDNTESVRKPLNVSELLPNDLSLYRYYGSLTTPGCFEVVHWNVFTQPVPISAVQLDAFKDLQDGHHSKLDDNFRPTMPLAGRKVTEYAKVVRSLKPGPNAPDNHKIMGDTDYDTTFGKPDADKSGKTVPTASSSSVAISSIYGILSVLVFNILTSFRLNQV